MLARRFAKDLVVTAFAVITSGLIAYLLALLNVHLKFSLADFSFNFIPVGALLFGAAAASGFVLGFRLFPHRLTWLLWLSSICLSVATYFFVSYLVYSSLQVRGVPLSGVIPFGQYLIASIENQKLYINTSNFAPGPLNYLFVLLRLAGFALGGLVVVKVLFDMPCCDHCDRRLQNPAILSRVSNSLLDLEEVFQGMRTSLNEGRSTEAVQLANSPNTSAPDGVHKLTLTLWKCDRCPVEYFKMFIKPGGEHVGRAKGYSPSH